MKESINELGALRVLIESQFKMLNRKISESDKNIVKLLKKVENEEMINQYTPILHEGSIKIRSYMDS